MVKKIVIDMTAQIPDEFILNGENFSLVGMKGNGLFEPLDFGIIPHSASTACWRGYVMKYHFTKDKLILDGMRVNTNDPPRINGIEPEKEGNLFKYYYKNLNLKTNFTGKVLLAKDFIQSMYVHMGFQRPIAFETVVEIDVKSGEIISVRDLSKQMEEYRDQNPN
ncbi:unnamed protein product, partial [marine sediment metagenome]